MLHRSIWFSSLLWVTLVGCSSDNTSGTNTSGTSGAGTVTAVCSQFQSAICSYAADKCMLESRAKCDSDYQSLVCKSDAAAQTCIDQLGTSTCPSVPPSCAISAVADTAPAVASCNKLVDASCDYAARCNVSDKPSCLSSVNGSLDCSKAAGITSSFSMCLSDLGSAACPSTPSAFALPPSCKGTIKVFQSAPAAQGPGWHAELMSPTATGHSLR